MLLEQLDRYKLDITAIQEMRCIGEGVIEKKDHIFLFRIVFWDVLPCKMIVDRRFRGAYCLHHQG
jgi:hypothetical protein